MSLVFEINCMETLKSILQSIRAGFWGVTIDLKDTYLHVPVHPSSRKWLQFKIGDQSFEFRVLPFGLSTSPRVFTRIVKVVAEYLRSKGFIVFVYLDDFLILAESREALLRDLGETRSLLSELGFLINEGKSCLDPSQRVQFLGAILDLGIGMVTPTPDRVLVVCACAELVLSSQVVEAALLMRLLGLIASLVDLVPWCRLRMRPIQLHLASLYRPWVHPLHHPVPIPASLHVALGWWSEPQHMYPSTASDFGPHNGRIKDGMGCPPGEVPPSRHLVSPSEKVPHQSLGDVGNISGLEQNSAHCSWSLSSHSHRQRDGGVLPAEAGRHSQSVALRSGLAPTVLVCGQVDLSDRRVSPREGEHSRGCTVQRGTSVHQASSVEGVVGRVASPSGDLSDRLLPSRVPSSRSVCVQTQPAAPELLFLGGGPGIMGKERPGSELGRAPCVCLPSNSIDSEGPLQVDSVDRLSHVAGGPSLATSDMVCSANGPSNIRTGPPSNLSRPSCAIGIRRMGTASN